MGHSHKVQDAMTKDQKVSEYFKDVEKRLKEDAKGDEKKFGDTVQKFYSDTKYDDKKPLASAERFDHMLTSEFKLDNLKAVVQKISDAVYGKSSEGSVDKEGVEFLKKNAAVGEYAAFAHYVAGEVLGVIVGVITSFGTSLATEYRSSLRSVPCGHGVQAFVLIGEKLFKEKDFWGDDSVISYRYRYESYYSEKQFRGEGRMAIITSLENQIARFAELRNAALDKFANDVDSLNLEKYDEIDAACKDHIDKALARIKELNKNPR